MTKFTVKEVATGVIIFIFRMAIIVPFILLMSINDIKWP